MENLGFDLDGVLHNFVVPAYRYIKNNYKGVFDFDFYTFWRDADTVLTKEEWNKILDVPELYLSPALEEDVETVNKLAKKYNIFYVTNRPVNVIKTTLNWLVNEEFPVTADHLFVVQGSKRPIVESIKFKYFVDDRLHVIEQIKDLTTVIVKRTPWNRQNREHREISRIEELLNML